MITMDRLFDTWRDRLTEEQSIGSAGSSRVTKESENSNQASAHFFHTCKATRWRSALHWIIQARFTNTRPGGPLAVMGTIFISEKSPSLLKASSGQATRFSSRIPPK